MSFKQKFIRLRISKRDDLFDLMLTIEAYESTTPAVRASVTRGGRRWVQFCLPFVYHYACNIVPYNTHGMLQRMNKDDKR